MVVGNLAVGLDIVEVMGWMCWMVRQDFLQDTVKLMNPGLVVMKDKVTCGDEMKVWNGSNVEFAEVHSIYSTSTKSIQVLDCEDLSIDVPCTCTSTWWSSLRSLRPMLRLHECWLSYLHLFPPNSLSQSWSSTILPSHWLHNIMQRWLQCQHNILNDLITVTVTRSNHHGCCKDRQTRARSILNFGKTRCSCRWPDNPQEMEETPIFQSFCHTRDYWIFQDTSSRTEKGQEGRSSRRRMRQSSRIKVCHINRMKTT